MGWIRWIPVAVACAFSTGAFAETKAQIAVAPVEGNLPAKALAAIERGARGAVAAKRIDQATWDEVSGALAPVDGPRDDPACRALGKRLGVRAVLDVIAMDAGEQVTLMLRVIPTDGGAALVATANAPRAGAEARVRALTSQLMDELLPQLRAREPRPPVTAAAAGPNGPWAPATGSTTRCRLLDKRCSGRRSLRQLGVFGIGMAVHGGSTYLAAMVMMIADSSDRALILGGAITLGVTPFISAGAAKGIGGRGCYAVSYGPLLAGSLSGAAVAYGAGLAYVLSGSNNGFWMATSLFVLPGLLPAIGVAIAYSAARERRPCAGTAAQRKRKGKWRGWRWARTGVELEPPSPTTIVAWDGSGSVAPGISLGRLTF